jgi:hypothetical protein
MKQFNSYVQELETLIRATKRSHSVMMIAGDFNLKAPALGGYVNDRRGTSLLNMFTKNGIVPIRMKEDHTFCKNGRKSFLDIISTNKGLAKNYADGKLSKI